jgi:serine/threonine protein kinase
MSKIDDVNPSDGAPRPEPKAPGTQVLPSGTGTQMIPPGSGPQKRTDPGTQMIPPGSGPQKRTDPGTQWLPPDSGAQKRTDPGTQMIPPGSGPQKRTDPGTQWLPPDSGAQKRTDPGTQAIPPGSGPQKRTDPGTQALPTGSRPKAVSGPAGTAWVTPAEPGSRPPPAMTPIEVAAADADAGEFLPGEHVGQYELIRRLGRGGMGEVYLARDTKLGRRVAIKFLHTEDPALVKRFVLEARATARCGHENIVTLYEADEFQGRPYMVLEYLQGHTLADLLRGQALPPGRAVELITPVLRALAAAHAQGIVHRDLKPENVMLTDAGVLKVLDFGIAKVQEEQRASPGDLLAQAATVAPATPAARSAPASGTQAALTEHGMIFGTMLYMSPEQWLAEAVDHRTDLWAVGIMLYQMLAGRHPLPGADRVTLERRVTGREPMPRLNTAAPGVPLRLADAVDACLAKDPAKRPAGAQALLEALAPFMPGRLTRELKVDESPYAGLSAFQESNADLFFGRAHEAAALVHRLRDEPLVAVVGPSGVGKSSFVRAGIIPALKRLGEAWDAFVVRPGRTPLAALAGVLSPTTANTGAGSVADEVGRERDLHARLVAEPGYAGAVLRTYARRKGRKVLVFVDQLEEMFTLSPDPDEQRAFSACLAGMADDAASPVRVVVSIRSDFLDRVFDDARLSAARPGLFFLSTPSDEGLRDALALPAEVAGYRFESPAMVDELVHDLRSTHGALSLLQFAATQLWEARDVAHKVLTRESYQAIGGIAGALARYADRVLEELSPEARRAARELFLLLVTSDRTRAIVSLEELQEIFRGRPVFDQLVEQLVQARLLVIQKSERGSTAEIVHESLIQSWPTLRRWLDESGEDAHFLEQLRAGARQWEAGGRRRGLLWRGETADEARRFHKRHRGDLPDLQREFLDAVVTQATRAARLRRTLVMGGIGALTLVVIASLVALVVIRNAQKEAVHQADLARKAEVTARTAEAAAKERADALAVKEQQRAEAAQRAESASAELQKKNNELVSALGNAEAARQEATKAQANAERSAADAQKSAADARRQQERADAAARQLAAQLKTEQERVKRLKDQFGSPLADTLPR